MDVDTSFAQNLADPFIASDTLWPEIARREERRGAHFAGKRQELLTRFTNTDNQTTTD
jgi:hypothetical protein